MINFRIDMANDIRVSDGNVVVVGAATRDTSYYSGKSACCWLNGELHYLVNQYDVPDGMAFWKQ